MNQNQPEQEGFIQKANEYRQKSSNTMYVISFLFGLMIIISGYTVLKAILEYFGFWAYVLLIAIISVYVVRKL